MHIRRVSERKGVMAKMRREVDRGGLEQIFSSVNRCLPDRTDMEIDGTKKVGERGGSSPSARTRPGQVTTLGARRRDESDDAPGAAGPRHYD